MTFSRVPIGWMVVVLAFSLFAGADSIPYQDDGSRHSISFSHLNSAGIPSITLLLDSVIAQNIRSAQPQKGVLLVYGERFSGNDSVRNLNVLEWLFRAIVRLVLPNHGRGRARR